MAISQTFPLLPKDTIIELLCLEKTFKIIKSNFYLTLPSLVLNHIPQHHISASSTWLHNYLTEPIYSIHVQNYPGANSLKCFTHWSPFTPLPVRCNEDMQMEMLLLYSLRSKDNIAA